jgi:hypothetical protein
MKITKMGTTVALTGLATAAMALPPFLNAFDANYNLKKLPNLKRANCAVCHVGTSPKFNPYGLDLKKELEREKTKIMTTTAFKRVENLDSDKDGVKNIDEIRADSLPGDPKSMPVRK